MSAWESAKADFSKVQRRVSTRRHRCCRDFQSPSPSFPARKNKRADPSSRSARHKPSHHPSSIIPPDRSYHPPPPPPPEPPPLDPPPLLPLGLLDMVLAAELLNELMWLV